MLRTSKVAIADGKRVCCDSRLVIKSSKHSWIIRLVQRVPAFPFSAGAQISISDRPTIILVFYAPPTHKWVLAFPRLIPPRNVTPPPLSQTLAVMNLKQLWATAAILALSAFGPRFFGVWAQSEMAACRAGWEWVRYICILFASKKRQLVSFGALTCGLHAVTEREFPWARSVCY